MGERNDLASCDCRLCFCRLRGAGWIAKALKDGVQIALIKSEKHSLGEAQRDIGRR
jgi:hypothetical protein